MLEQSAFQNTDLKSIETDIVLQLLKSRFIRKCANKGIALVELKKFIAQHAFYSYYFTRYICAVLSNLPNQDDFYYLMDNLWDELGLRDDAKVSHATLFQQMSKKLNVDMAVPVYPATQQMIDAMFTYCRNPDPIYGVTALCLGAEAIVPILYAYIVSGFKLHQINPNDLKFFTIHIECDHSHADMLRKILKSMLADYPEKYDIVRAVAFSMIKLRTEFLDALLD